MARAPLHERLPAPNSPELEERADALFRELCTRIIAKRDVDEAIMALAELDRLAPEDGSALHHALCQAAAIAYARPFITKGNRDGLNRLDKHVVPEAMRALHDDVLGHRDSVVAHSPVSQSEPQLTLLVEEGPPDAPSRFIITSAYTQLRMTTDHANRFRDLCLAVSKAIDKDRDALLELFEASPAVARRFIKDVVPLMSGTLADSEHDIHPPLP